MSSARSPGHFEDRMPKQRHRLYRQKRLKVAWA